MASGPRCKESDGWYAGGCACCNGEWSACVAPDGAPSRGRGTTISSTTITTITTIPSPHRATHAATHTPAYNVLGVTAAGPSTSSATLEERYPCRSHHALSRQLSAGSQRSLGCCHGDTGAAFSPYRGRTKTRTRWHSVWRRGRGDPRDGSVGSVGRVRGGGGGAGGGGAKALCARKGARATRTKASRSTASRDTPA